MWQPREEPSPVWSPEEPGQAAGGKQPADSEPVQFPDFSASRETAPSSMVGDAPSVPQFAPTEVAWNPASGTPADNPGAGITDGGATEQGKTESSSITPAAQALQQDFGIVTTPAETTVVEDAAPVVQDSSPQMMPAALVLPSSVPGVVSPLITSAAIAPAADAPAVPAPVAASPASPGPAAPAPAAPAAAPPQFAAPQFAAPQSAPVATSTAATPAFPTTTYSREKTVSPAVFNALLSYASAATLAVIYLLYTIMSGSNTASNLESLPDLSPPKAKKGAKTALILVPVDAPMPAMHTLKIGQTVRYGSVAVTAVRVTRGPVEFVHYDSTSKEKKDPEGPVLKLHLRFENVSSDQDFPPLDRALVFDRKLDQKNYGTFLANNFVCNADEKERDKCVLMYDLPEGSSWDLKDEHLGKVINPGEVLETYLATTAENLDTLNGPLLWRVHFRKGYNRKSLRGVTTVIEVAFDSDEVENEPGTQAPAPSA